MAVLTPGSILTVTGASWACSIEIGSGSDASSSISSSSTGVLESLGAYSKRERSQKRRCQGETGVARTRYRTGRQKRTSIALLADGP